MRVGTVCWLYPDSSTRTRLLLRLRLRRRRRLPVVVHSVPACDRSLFLQESPLPVPRVCALVLILIRQIALRADSSFRVDCHQKSGTLRAVRALALSWRRAFPILPRSIFPAAIRVPIRLAIPSERLV